MAMYMAKGNMLTSRHTLIRNLHISSFCAGYKLKDNIKDCYSLLRVPPDSSDKELHKSFLKLVKEYHPDSGTNTADHKKFVQIQEAYDAIRKERTAKRDQQVEPGDMEIFDIKHTAPQHRQYLSFEGKGSGTLSERERQYRQIRAEEAYYNVHDYKIQQVNQKYETSLIAKDLKATKKNVIRNTLDRLAEDLIQEAMAKGEFDNLRGMGKPLKSSEHNPMLDSFTHNLNKVLINCGHTPEWAQLHKEIRESIKTARAKLEDNRTRLGPEPLPSSKAKLWNIYEKEFCDRIDVINKQIFHLNLTVPKLWQQMMPYTADKEIGRIIKKYNELVASGSIPQNIEPVLPKQEVKHKVHEGQEKVTWAGVLKDIRAMFSS